MIEHVCVCILIYIYILHTIYSVLAYNMNDKTAESLAAAVALSHHDEDARKNTRCYTNANGPVSSSEISKRTTYLHNVHMCIIS